MTSFGSCDSGISADSINIKMRNKFNALQDDSDPKSRLRRFSIKLKGRQKLFLD